MADFLERKQASEESRLSRSHNKVLASSDHPSKPITQIWWPNGLIWYKAGAICLCQQPGIRNSVEYNWETVMK